MQETKRYYKVKKIVNQMIKGARFGKSGLSQHQFDVFTRAHYEKIRWIMARVPEKYSSAVSAVLVKAIIVYGPEKVEEFCTALRTLVFKGPNDPVHKLWLYLLKPQGKTAAPEVYRKTVSAVRAYMKDRNLKRSLSGRIKTDIFEWDEDLTLPDYLVEQNDLYEKKIISDNASLPVPTDDESPDDENIEVDE